MSPTIMKYSLAVAIVVAAAVAGLWFFLAPPKAEPIVVPKVEGPGTIEGTTSYPSDFVPAQKVCAQSTADASYERCADVPESVGGVAPTFSIKVAPGTYTVYAVLKNPSELGLTQSRRAYWTAYVKCGLAVGCPSHAHEQVIVGTGKTVTGVLPHDWYAD